MKKIESVDYAVKVLQKKLCLTEFTLKQYEDLAATCSKWLEYGVNIEYFAPLFREHLQKVDELRDKRRQLRTAIKMIQ